jgi:hypothetical protein
VLLVALAHGLCPDTETQLGANARPNSTKESKQFFFEKKNQKTFIRLTHLSGEGTARRMKSLLLLFFRKEVLSA